MNPLLYVSSPLCFLLLLALPIQAADRMFRLETTSRLKVEGTSKIRNWSVETHEIDIAEFSGMFSILGETNKTLKSGKVQANIRGSIPVDSFRSSTDSWVDKKLSIPLRGDTNPRILFRFDELTLKESPVQRDGAHIFKSQCELVVAGVTNQIPMSLTMTALGAGKIELTGNTSLRMSIFGVNTNIFPPADVGDEVEISFLWLLVANE